MKLQVRKTVKFEDLHWQCTRERLAARIMNTGLVPDKLVEEFCDLYLGRIRPLWLASSAVLSQGQNLVVAALCECHGCDQITIERWFDLSIGFIGFPVYQKTVFSSEAAPRDVNLPQPAGVTARIESALVRIGPKHFCVDISSYGKLFIFSALTVVLASLFYALVGILLIYGLAVFYQFVSAPGETTIAATERAEIGIALLAVMVGLAALIRGSVKSVFALLRRSK